MHETEDHAEAVDASILNPIAAGGTAERLLADYPYLEAEDVR